MHIFKDYNSVGNMQAINYNLICKNPKKSPKSHYFAFTIRHSCIIGVYPTELMKPQKLFFHINTRILSNKKISKKKTKSSIIKSIKLTTKNGRIKLLESTAYEIAHRIRLNTPELTEITITIKKPAALSCALYSYAKYAMNISLERTHV